MPQYRIEDPLPCSQQAFWRMVFDPAFETQVDQQSQILRERIQDCPRPVDLSSQVTLRSKITPQRDWPAFIRKALPAALTYIETQHFDPLTQRMKVETQTGVLPSEFEVRGELWAEAQGPDAVLRIWEGQCRCSIPILGKRIEKAIIDQIRNTFAQSTRVAHSWLESAS